MADNFITRLFSRGEEEKRYAGSIVPYLSGKLPVYSTTGLNTGQDSLQLTAVYSAVSKIADTIASLETCVLREKDGNPVELYDHPVARRIGREPNPLMGAYEFWQLIVSDALLYGVGHAHILEDGEIYHIPAPEVNWTVDEKTGRKWYAYKNAPSPVPQENWLEIKAFRSLNPTHTQYQNLRTQKSIQDFGTKFFESGGMLGGILSTKEHLSVEQMREAANMWEREYTGSQNAHKIAILGGGFGYQPLSVPLDQLRWLEGRKYGSEEIARMFAIPPAMLGMESNTAYSNYEQQVLQFHQGCVLPWVRRIELEIERKLLKQVSLRAKFKVDSLLRADLKTRAEYYHSLLGDGVLCINEVRAKEGYGPVEGGNEHHLQVNQLPLSSMKDYAESITTQNEKSIDNDAADGGDGDDGDEPVRPSDGPESNGED